MFATLIVDLPARHTGGDLVLSPTHSGERERISWDFYDTSSTCILAWYTDVVHEVKPVTGGYRLVLSYNLIHTAPDTSSPSYQPPVPVTDADKISRLRQVLERWDEGKYPTSWDGDDDEGDRSPPFFAYVLDHNYSANDLATGALCLKGADDHKVGLLAPLAKEFNIRLALANLEHKMEGPADDYDNYQEEQSLRQWQRRRHREEISDEDEDDEDEDEDEERGEYTGYVGMITGEWRDRFYALSNFHSFEGASLISDSGNDDQSDSPKSDGNYRRYDHWGRNTPKRKKQKLGCVELKRGHGVVIPDGAFEEVKPDDEEYTKGYMGNVSAVPVVSVENAN
jgi:hypothetical protein